MRIGKKTKAKIKKGCEGAITLFLCILMTPFLMLASALVEFSRYQQAAELVNELMDCSALSVLANFDKYLEERFGLFGIKQDCDIAETYKTSIMANSGLMGKSISLNGEISAAGSVPLSDHNVLKTQLMDFSESTVLTEILLEDLNIGELLEKLDNLSAIKRISNVATAVGDLSGSVKDLVIAGDELIKTIDAAKTSVSDFINKFKSLCSSLKSLVEEFSSGEDIILDNIKDNYLEKVKDIYQQCRTLIDDGKSLIQKVNDIKTSFGKLKTAFQKAKEDLGKSKDAVTSVSNEAKSEGNSNEGDNLKKTGDSSNATYDEIIDAVGSAINETGEEFIDDIKTTFTEAVNDLKDTLKEKLGEIVDETKGSISDYFTGDLSSYAQTDLNTIVGLVRNLYSAYQEDNVNGIENYIKGLIPDCFFDNDLSKLRDILNSAIEKAGKTLEDNITEKADNLIGDLIDAIGKLFNLDVFYNKDLNTYLSDDVILENEQNNPYITLLKAISQFIQAGNDFRDAISLDSGLGLIERIKKLFEAVSNFISGVVNIVNSIIDAASMMIEMITELVGYIAEGNWQGLYERLLLSGYMVHNLPNRTMAKYDTDAGKVVIKGKSLTGYEYKNISIPHGNAGQSADDAKGLTGLSNFLANYGSETTSNQEMFKGAELEFIAAGTQSEIMNQVAAFMQLYMLRLLLDVVPILTNGEVAEMAAGANIACWAVYIIVILAEPLCDTVLLVNSAETQVPFFKTTCFLTPSGLKDLISALLSATGSSFAEHLQKKLGVLESDNSTGIFNMDYKSHFLLILMFSVPTDRMVTRAANLINIETAYHYKQAGVEYTFSLDNAYSNVDTKTEIELNSFISIFQSSSETAAVKSVLSRTKGY